MNKLKEYRKLAGVTQQKLADTCGCKQPAVWAIEGGSMPNVDLGRKIIKALNSTGKVNVTLDDVFPPQDQEAA